MIRDQRVAKRTDQHAAGAPTFGAAESQHEPGTAPAHRRDSQPRRPGRGRRHGVRRLPLVLLTTDLLAFLGAALSVSDTSRRVLAMGALSLALWAAGGLYRPRLTPAVLDELPSLLARTLVAGAVIMGVGAFIDGYAGRVTLIAAVIFAALALVGRSIVYGALRAARQRGHFTYRTLILGEGEVGRELAETLLHHPEIGLRPVGFLDDDPFLSADRRPIPHLGGSTELVNVILEKDIANVVVAFGSLRESKAIDLLRDCDRLACEIFFVPRLYEVHAMHRDMEMIRATPLVRMRRAAFRTPLWRLKRVMDVIGSAVGLVVLSPVLVSCGLAVALSTGRPLLFRQQRVGLDGRPFTLLKFCTLRPDGPEDSGKTWNIRHDARLSRVGRFLRRTSLDELPQLWNVLRGDMSLVGPRPERPYFVDAFTQQFPRYMARHRVPAGLTGAAQVAGLRGDTSISERAKFDNYYIENWSLWEDCKILLRTTGNVIRGTGG